MMSSQLRMYMRRPTSPFIYQYILDGKYEISKQIHKQYYQPTLPYEPERYRMLNIETDKIYSIIRHRGPEADIHYPYIWEGIIWNHDGVTINYSSYEFRDSCMDKIIQKYIEFEKTGDLSKLRQN